MKSLSIFFIALICFVSTQAADYYFSYSYGANGNTGVDSANAKQYPTQSFVNSLSNGDNLFFYRGDTWRDIELTFSGLSTITLDDYGPSALSKPNLTLGAWFTSGWTHYSGNIYYNTNSNLPTNNELSIPFYNDASTIYNFGLGVLVKNDTAFSVGSEPDGQNYFEVDDASYTLHEDEGGYVYGQEWIETNDLQWGSNHWGGNPQAHIFTFSRHWTPVILRVSSYNYNPGGDERFDVAGWRYSGWGNDYLFHQFQHGDPGNKSKFKITNHINTLDNDGEYAYDFTSKTLYLYSDSHPDNDTVFFPYGSHVLYFLECDDIVLRDIEVWGGLKSAIYFAGGDGANVENCISRYSFNGLKFDQNDNDTVVWSRFTNCVTNGIYSRKESNWYIRNNYIYDINVYDGLGPTMSYNDDGFGINSYRSKTGHHDIKYNWVERIGSNGIFNNQQQNSASVTHEIERNVVKGNNIKSTDGGAIYDFGCQVNSGNKVWGNNVVMSPSSNPGFTKDGHTETHSLYHDGHSHYFLVDSNVIYDFDDHALYLHGTHTNTLVDNVGFDNNHGANSNAVFGLTEYGGHDATTFHSHTIKRNRFILGDEESLVMNLIRNTVFDGGGTVLDSNYYWLMASNGDEINDTEVTKPDFDWINHGYKSYSEYQSLTSWDSNSTYTVENASVGNVYFFINISDETYYFDLGSATFKDQEGFYYLDSVGVPPFYAKGLLRLYGSTSGIDNQVYIDSTLFAFPDIETTQDVTDPFQPCNFQYNYDTNVVYSGDAGFELESGSFFDFEQNANDDSSNISLTTNNFTTSDFWSASGDDSRDYYSSGGSWNGHDSFTKDLGNHFRIGGIARKNYWTDNSYLLYNSNYSLYVRNGVDGPLVFFTSNGVQTDSIYTSSNYEDGDEIRFDLYVDSNIVKLTVNGTLVSDTTTNFGLSSSTSTSWTIGRGPAQDNIWSGFLDSLYIYNYQPAGGATYEYVLNENITTATISTNDVFGYCGLNIGIDFSLSDFDSLDYVVYDIRALNSYDSISLNFNGYSDGVLELRSGSLNGPVLGTISVNSSGGYSTFGTTLSSSIQSGDQMLYLVAEEGNDMGSLKSLSMHQTFAHHYIYYLRARPFRYKGRNRSIWYNRIR